MMGLSFGWFIDLYFFLHVWVVEGVTISVPATAIFFWAKPGNLG